jgi:phage protein U
MYAQIGNIIFRGLLGFESLNSTRESNLVEHLLIDGKPRLQRVGDKLEEVQFTLNLHVSYCNPAQVLAELELARAEGFIMPFIEGNGTFLGMFAIKSVRKEITKTNAFGDIVRAFADVTMVEIADANPAGSEEQQAKRDGFANAGNNPAAFSGPLAVSTEASALAAAPIAVAADGQAVTRNLELASQQPAREASALEDTTRRLRRMRDNLESLQTGLNNAQNTYQSAQQIQNSVQSALSAVEGVRTLAAQGNLTGALAANGELIRANTNLLGASSELATLSATRIN